MVNEVEKSGDSRIVVRDLVSASSIIQGTMFRVVDFQSAVRLLLSTQGSIEEQMTMTAGWDAGVQGRAASRWRRQERWAFWSGS